jgi:hypothetical protein
MYDFVFRQHFALAVDGFLLFVVGLFVAWPVLHYRLRGPAALPIAVFRVIVRVLGPAPSLARIAGTIFCFNSAAIFVDMASGWHPILPKLMAIWTGMNVGVVVGMARTDESLAAAPGRTPGQWVPPPRLAALCGALVLIVELSCFWFSIAMGISMGLHVQAGTEQYLAALGRRALAYVAVVMPLLLLSALAEAVTVRASSAERA